MKQKKYHNFLPLIISLSVVVGIILGTFYASYFRSNRLNIFSSGNSKINDLLYAIEDRYVDTVNMNDLIEGALPRILSELDPHSTYTSAKKVEEEMQGLKGSFSGIGVIFSIIDDTARIIRVVPGGPSEDTGLMAGDRIVSVDGKSFVGKFLDEDYAMKALRGQDKSKVRLGIKRSGTKGTRTYEVIRGAVPVKTVDIYAMISDETGYIKISSFGENTYEEFLVALAELSSHGCKSLIIDLRDNGGGYMEAAVRIANQFLPKNRMIVYTQGRKSERMDYRSDGRGDYQNIPLVVVVNENTASASEIFTAAIQDNDRGTIVGLRTFGKGLVQEPIQFADGSLLKLTIARYYSPSGRCLQKPYVPGENESYQNDLYSRYLKGEFSTQDSIHMYGKKYHTLIGRTVYGGGGIMPDVFIPTDTTDITSYLMEAVASRRLAEFAYQYADRNRQKLSDMQDWEKLENYLKRQNLVGQFATYAEKKGQKRRNLLIKKSYKRLDTALTGNVINYIFGDEASALYQCQYDKSVKEALRLIDRHQTFPQKPGKKAGNGAAWLNGNHAKTAK